MEVKIKEGVHEYKSDFDDGWHFSRGDYFKYPVKIGSGNCFIKRFEKKREDISGWELLEKLKEKNVPNLTRVYDVVEAKEDGRTVYYVFFEFIEGKTLHEFVSKKNEFSLEKFTDDLFTALQNLHARNYWFADFCEKNIFAGKSGNFLLIDLDSAQAVTDAPHTEMWGSKDYWALVFKFCKDILHLSGFKPSQFNGASFNYLHSIFLILRLKIFYDNDEIEYYYSDEFMNQLPFDLNNASPSFKKIFDKVFQNEKQPLKAQDIKEIKNLIKEKILGLHVVPDISPKPVREKLVINDFTVRDYVEKNDDGFTIESGKAFILAWDVQNAQRLQLDRNGELYRQLNKDENNIELKEVSEEEEKLIEYTLTASRDDETLELVEKTSLTVKIIYNKPPVIKPSVIEFAVNNYHKKTGDYYVVESGKAFKLTWNVNNAREIEIQQDGQHFATVTSTEKSMDITENVQEGKEKKINYTLSALSADTSEVSSVSLHIVVKGPPPFHPVIKKFQTSKRVLRDRGAFTLNWNVQNATEIALYKDDVLIETFKGGEKNVELKENYEGIKRKIKYTLQASNGFEKANSQPVIIFVKPPIPLKRVLMVAASLVLLLALFFMISLLGHHQKKDKIVFYHLNSDTIRVGDTITIMGKNLPENDNFIGITFNDVPGKIIKPTNDSVRVQVPELKDSLAYVKIVANIESNMYPIAQHLAYVGNVNPNPPFPQLNPPGNHGPPDTPVVQNGGVKVNQVKVGLFKAPTLTEGETITISGENLPLKGGAVVVEFNGVPGHISIQRTKFMAVEVPALAQETNNVNISVFIKNKLLMTSKNIRYQHSQSPVSTTVHPLKESVVVEGNYIDISGENLNTGNVVVKFNQVQASIITKNPNDLRVQVPSLDNGVNRVTISVVVNGREIKAFDSINYLHKNSPKN